MQQALSAAACTPRLQGSPKMIRPFQNSGRRPEKRLKLMSLQEGSWWPAAMMAGHTGGLAAAWQAGWRMLGKEGGSPDAALRNDPVHSADTVQHSTVQRSMQLTTTA